MPGAVSVMLPTTRPMTGAPASQTTMASSASAPAVAGESRTRGTRRGGLLAADELALNDAVEFLELLRRDLRVDEDVWRQRDREPAFRMAEHAPRLHLVRRLHRRHMGHVLQD